jgi:hypothetical protein
MRPPMCLQYAIWTMAANGHEKYNEYTDIFYQRTRHYLEVDELKVCLNHRWQQCDLPGPNSLWRLELYK